jgi:hypothetical protein
MENIVEIPIVSQTIPSKERRRVGQYVEREECYLMLPNTFSFQH